MSRTPAWHVTLEQNIMQWMFTNWTGAVICEETLDENSYVIPSIISIITDKYQSQIPVYTMNANANTTTDVLFYKEISKIVECNQKETNSVGVLRNNLVKTLFERLSDTKYKSMVLIINGAQCYRLNHYRWLIDIQNALDWLGIHLSVCFVGNEQLLTQKNIFVQENEKQIVARFMVNEICINQNTEYN